MAINLMCDNCGKFVKKVNPGDIQKMRPNESMVCNKCLKKIEDWSNRVDTAGNDAISQITQMKKEALTEFKRVFEDRTIQDGRS